MKEFFPTPAHIVTQLIDGLDTRYKKVLDPSAGKGDILSRIAGTNGYNRSVSGHLYAIEINPELRPILIDKGFKVIGTDFLTYPGLQYFDFIIMNPPFSEGAKHLLKAWNIANGATIRCLLNSDTLSELLRPKGSELPVSQIVAWLQK
jgi:type I restriction-modification system DNA methylase subunit